MIGLNLRMTEITAAISCAQLAKVEKILQGRRELARTLTDMVKDIAWIRPPIEDTGCSHSYYIWAAQVKDGKREDFVDYLNQAGFPMRKGYSPPLNRIFDKSQLCPVTEKMEDEQIICFEVCSHDPTKKQLKIMRDIIHAAADNHPMS